MALLEQASLTVPAPSSRFWIGGASSVPSRDENENQLAGTVGGSLRRWLTRARDVVMKPFRDRGGMPDADAIFSTQPAWDAEVETILTHIGRISMDAWSGAVDVPPVSRHSFVMAGHDPGLPRPDPG